MVKNILFSSDGGFMVVHYTSQNYLNVYEATKKPKKLFTVEEQDKITSSCLSWDNSHLLLNVS